VHLSRRDLEVDAVEDLLASGFDTEILDFEHHC
jgi:hypothetical protein